MPSATTLGCARNFGAEGGRGGIGQPSATTVGCAGDFGDGGGRGGIGVPSAAKEEPIVDRPRWCCCPVEGSNNATRTINVNTLRIRPLRFRESMSPPAGNPYSCSVSQFVPQNNTARQARRGGTQPAVGRPHNNSWVGLWQEASAQKEDPPLQSGTRRGKR